jgi:type IV secretory pathway VirB10-like protein
MAVRFLNSIAVLALMLSALSPTVITSATAQQIYKSVDADGNVSYSGEPPQPGESGQETETIQALPEPDPADVEAALQRLQQADEEIELLRQQRAEQAEKQERAKDSGTTIVVTSNPFLVPVPQLSRHRRPAFRPRAHRSPISPPRMPSIPSIE